MNRYDLILWAKSRYLDINEKTEIAYDILSALIGFGDELAPNYLPAYEKRLVKEFVFSKEAVRKRLEEGIDEEALRLFNRSSSRISFFSSLDDDRTSGVSINIGDCGQFINACIVSLPRVDFSGLTSRREEFIGLFKTLIEIFNPYYGFVANKSRSPGRFWSDDKPTEVHWLNYYDNTTAKAIGLNKVMSVNGIEKLGRGYFFKLQDEPLELNNPEHLQRQRELAELLCL